MNDRRTPRSAILLACLMLGTGCSNSVLDSCISACQHIFFDCQGVVRIGNEILTASDYPACQNKCHEVADAGGICQDQIAAFDCVADITCEAFQPNAGVDAGTLLSNCEKQGKCGAQQ